MSDKTRVMALPDAVSVTRESILRAALFFDEVHLAAFTPFETISDPADSSLLFRVASHLLRDTELDILKDAGVIRTVDFPSYNLIPSLSSRELPVDLRKAVARSMRQGTTLMTAFFDTAAHGRSEFTMPYRLQVNDPANLDDSRIELAICNHLISFFMMLGICVEKALIPMADHTEHAALIAVLAQEFPAVATALGAERAGFAVRHNAVATRVLEDLLPDLRPNCAKDILSLREEMRDELESFRTEIGRLATQVVSVPQEESFRREIDDVIARDVRPALDTLKRRMANPSRRMIKHLVSDWESIIAGAGIPVGFWFMRQVTLPWAILAGLSAGAGIAAIKAKMEEWSVRGDSAFTFVFDAQKRLMTSKRGKSK